MSDLNRLDRAMTEDITGYKFDFAKEALQILRELGDADRLITFAEVGINRRRDEPAEILQITEGRFTQAVSNFIKDLYRENPGIGSCHGMIDPFFGLGEFVSLYKDEAGIGAFGKKYKDLLRLLILYHEAGHIAISQDYSKAKNECAADAYAAIRLLQRFGNDAVPLLSMWSWFRAWNAALHGDREHLSTIVIDHIIDKARQGNYDGLTHDQVVKYARDYARFAGPSERELRKLKKAFKKIPEQEKYTPAMAHSILEAGLRSKSQLAFYIAAKFFTPFMNPEGVEFYQQLSRYDAEMQNHYKTLIESRAGINQIPQVARRLGYKPASRLRRAFSKQVKRSQVNVMSSLQVSVPAGQERFSFDYR